MIRLLPDKSGEVLKARIPPRFAGFFVSVVVRGDPSETGVYWYTLRYIPINVYQLTEDPYMARTTRPLTHTEVQKAKALDKDLTLHDGDGLFLLVKTTGKKIWRFRYQLPNSNKRTMIILGAYPALSLADAREIRAEKLAMLVRGIDPQARADE
jgi:hypothetical protein